MPLWPCLMAEAMVFGVGDAISVGVAVLLVGGALAVKSWVDTVEDRLLAKIEALSKALATQGHALDKRVALIEDRIAHDRAPYHRPSATGSFPVITEDG